MGSRGGSTVDVMGTVAACAVVVVALRAGPVLTVLPAGPAYQGLTLAAAAVGAVAAVLASLGSRLTGERRPAWIGAALGLYCVIVLPWSAASSVDLDVVHRAARLVAYVGALVLLVLSMRPPRWAGRWGGWALVGVAVLAAMATLGLRDGGVLRWF